MEKQIEQTSLKKQIKNYGIDWEDIKKQVQYIKNGTNFITLERPAKIDDGIITLPNDLLNKLIELYENKITSIKGVKFIPASGAATRMFRFLNEFLLKFDPTKDNFNTWIDSPENKDLKTFYNQLKDFPFYNKLQEVIINKYPSFNSLSEEKKFLLQVKTLINDPEFNYSSKPKGLIPFTQKQNHVLTPVELHIQEAEELFKSTDVHLHFTIDKTFIEEFKSKSTDYSAIEINWSQQEKQTDSLTFNQDNSVYLNENQSPVFRPGGHGALIKNLNSIRADLVFIKNIDNISANNKSLSIKYKKAIGGLLIQLQKKLFKTIDDLNHVDNFDPIIHFLSSELFIEIDSKVFNQLTKLEKKTCLYNLLNRPLRICAMVKNEGQPGGGPFWVKTQMTSNLQIVETAQINTSNIQQYEILKKATHFNPVDIVCSFKNHKNKYFDLNQFIDHNTGFVVEKNLQGQTIKAYELPGLWNGAMANWNTVFVEAPKETFTPVKTVNDLLKPEHL